MEWSELQKLRLMSVEADLQTFFFVGSFAIGAFPCNNVFGIQDDHGRISQIRQIIILPPAFPPIDHNLVLLLFLALVFRDCAEQFFELFLSNLLSQLASLS